MIATVAYSFADLPDMLRVVSTIGASCLAFGGAGRLLAYVTRER